MNRSDLAQAIIRIARLTGEFRLRSGQTSTEYFDKYRFEGEPSLLREIAKHLAPLIPQDAEVLAGLELGGVPIAVALSLEIGVPAAFIRKQAKSYGTCRFAEGTPVEGRRVVVVEDVVTSGGQVISSAQALRSIGANLVKAICVIDRESGGSEALSGIHLDLSALFTRTQLDAASAA